MTSMVVSEQSRRATLAMLPLGAFETTPDGSWDFVTPAFVGMLGDLPTSSLLGREWLSRVHKDDFQRVLAEYRQAREFGRPWRQEFRMLAADGHIVHVGIDANPLPQDAGARGVRFVGLVKDRTQIVRAMEIANESDALVAQLQEAVREGIMINRVDVTVAANTAAARILGYDSPDELVGMEGAQRIHPDDLERLMDYARSQRESFMTGKFFKRDGSIVQLAIHGKPVMYAGAPARLVTFVPVSDEIVQTAIAARNELQLHALERLLQAPYQRIGLEGDAEGRIEYANQQMADLVGRPLEQLVGMHIRDVTHPDDVDASLDAVHSFDLTEGATPTVMDKRYLRPDGTVVEVQLRSAFYRDPVTGRAVSMTLATELTPPPCCRDLTAEELEQCIAFRSVVPHSGDGGGPSRMGYGKREHQGSGHGEQESGAAPRRADGR